MTEPGASDQLIDSAAVENLIQVLVKGLRAIQLYLPNNPIYQKAVGNVREAFGPVWEEHTELVVRVTESDLVWEGVSVYSQPSKSESVAWVLFKDGVRSLSLEQGVEDEEIVGLLEVIKQAQNLPKDAADDLLTLLWEQDFQHVRYTAVELGADGVTPLKPSDDGWIGGAAPEAEDIKRKIAEDTQEAETPTGIVRIDDFDSTLYFLDENELKYLQTEIEREYTRDLAGNVLAMIFDLLELQTYTAVRAELMSITENFIPYLLGAGDFHSVAYVLRELRAILERARELSPEQTKQIQAIPARLSQSEVLDQLLQSLDEAVTPPTEEDLSEMFGELRPQALQSVLEWLPRLSNEAIREPLEKAALRLVSAHPEEVMQTLEGAEESVILTTVRLVTRAQLPPFVPALAALLEREEVEIRKEAAAGLAAINSPVAMRELERGLDDKDSNVRVVAVRALGERGHRAALAKVEAAITGKTLRSAELTEKTAYFEAFGLLAGSAGIAALRPMLEQKGLLRKKEDPETRACAAMALGKIGDDEARAVLKVAATEEKEPLVKNAINRALREAGRHERA
ncbi:MAG: HEAT repeat domain-containing protein [Gemmatimonadota bacterium]|nr:MAG: HEAT repeat domain-containing protein [Gemmatimonadota bacterium]